MLKTEKRPSTVEDVLDYVLFDSALVTFVRLGRD